MLNKSLGNKLKREGILLLLERERNEKRKSSYGLKQISLAKDKNKAF